MQKTQRLGAYAVVVRDGSILLTRISAAGFPAGWWALPGGGVDHGEAPGDTVVRELFEETGMTAAETKLVAVHHIHTQSPGRGDQYEDYHGVHLLYATRVQPGVEPRVVEADGTTDATRWVPIDQVRKLGRLLPVVEYVLDRLDEFSVEPR